MVKTTDRFDRWFSLLNDTDRACVLAALMVLQEKDRACQDPMQIRSEAQPVSI